MRGTGVLAINNFVEIFRILDISWFQILFVLEIRNWDRPRAVINSKIVYFIKVWQEQGIYGGFLSNLVFGGSLRPWVQAIPVVLKAQNDTVTSSS